MDRLSNRPVESPVRKTLRLEPLEERIAPSGGIEVIVSGGSLKITGDAGNNDFEIEPRLAAGEYSIISGGDATLINGHAGPVVVSGVTKDVNIKLGDGDDSVLFDGINLPGNVKVDAGKGNDAFEIAFGSVAGNLGISMGDGNGDIDIGNCTIGGKVDIKGATGDDSVSLDIVTVNKGLSIMTGNGNLDASITDTSISTPGNGYDLKIVNGSGNVELNVDHVFVSRNFSHGQGPGHMSASFQDMMVQGNTQLKSGEGNDTVTFASAQLYGKLGVMTGSGELMMSVYNVSAGMSGKGCDAKIANGNGIADVAIENASIGGSLSVSNGNGHAAARVENVVVHKNCSYKSGDGADQWMLIWTTVEGKTSVNTGSGGDYVILDAIRLKGSLSVNAGSGNDHVYADAVYDYAPWHDTSIFEGPVSIILGSGDDYLGVGVGAGADGGAYYSRVFANGGAGWDELDYKTGTNYFGVEPSSVGFEYEH